VVTDMTETRPPQNAACLESLRRAPVVAILRGPDAARLVEPALTLFAAGIGLVEISLTAPGACDAISQVAARMPAGARVGAGTVLTLDDVADVAAAGAQFVVTPAVADSVGESVRRGLPVAAGAFTPTEALAAHRLGAAVVKLFPASAGGPAYLRALRDPFPQIPFMAVGGVGVDEAVAYLKVGAIGVGVGGPLLGDAATSGDLDSLAARAHSYLEAARGATA
jgi:2-dehydro-3-deoxyphosphogluconate aldolase / (4S)-4-hydroxy-2-oxoglutarate aldolase